MVENRAKLCEALSPLDAQTGTGKAQRLTKATRSGRGGEVFTKMMPRINMAVRQSVARVLTAEYALGGIDLSDDCSPAAMLCLNTVVEPILDIAERGGKSWRGYTTSICCETAGGDFSQHLDWLALTEVLHVGSLIVDDVEDAAHERRGGKSCHVIHGVPAAINAGCLAYFIALNIIDRAELPSRTKNRLYQEYSDLMRWAHIGQALDLALMKVSSDQLCSREALEEITRRATLANKLKSAIPFRTYARMGALLAPDPQEATNRFGELFQSVGNAFQLRDDILNIAGIPGTPGKLGEDIRNQKITIPVLECLKTIDGKDRARLVEAFFSAKSDETALMEAISVVKASGALEECYRIPARDVRLHLERASKVCVNEDAAELMAQFVEAVLEQHY